MDSKKMLILLAVVLIVLAAGFLVWQRNKLFTRSTPEEPIVKSQVELNTLQKNTSFKLPPFQEISLSLDEADAGVLNFSQEYLKPDTLVDFSRLVFGDGSTGYKLVARKDLEKNYGFSEDITPFMSDTAGRILNSGLYNVVENSYSANGGYLVAESNSEKREFYLSCNKINSAVYCDLIIK